MNASDMLVLQCIPAYRPRSVIRIASGVHAAGGKVLLDLEDAIQDVMCPENNSELKCMAVQAVRTIVAAFPRHRFGIRINDNKSAYYGQDLELVRELAPQLDSVFIPKLESREQFQHYLDDLPDTVAVNPIIETVEGLSGLQDILDATFRERTGYVFFGNYDYHLSALKYPVVDQDDDEYWSFVSEIISTVEEQGYRFGNSPYTSLDNFGVLEESVKRLRRLCQRDFALMSLHMKQTRSFFSGCSEQKSGPQLRETITPEVFRKHRQKDRAFSVHNGRIITPQEYQLMLLYGKLH